MLDRAEAALAPQHLGRERVARGYYHCSACWNDLPEGVEPEFKACPLCGHGMFLVDPETLFMADKPDPEKLLAYKIPEVLREYLYRTRELGSLEGDLGAMEIHPEFKKLVAAMHHVIAGGKIEVAVVEPGNNEVVSQLDAQWDESMGALGRR